MRKFLLAAAAACLVISVAGCSTAQLQQFQIGLSNFTAGVQSVNAAIAQTSAQLAQNCNNLQATAAALAALGAGSKAGPGLAAANAALISWCQNPPTDITTAITATAAEIQAAKAAYKAAKAGG